MAAYIPPENSPLHDIYDIDFFQKIETEASYFSQYGEVYLIGDLNSRVGKRCDFIDHDSTLPDFDDDIFSLDAPLRRLSIDSVVNRFGDHLLDLCKATEMRIVNGRIFPNTDKMTCFTHNGESVVDYLITCENNFSSLSSMTVHEYNEFSNHAPISFSFRVGNERSRETTTKSTSNVRWREEHKDEFVNSLKNDVHLLQNIVQQDSHVDIIVDNFSKFVTDRANLFFKKTSKVKNENIFTCSNVTEKKKWYDETCVLKKQRVQEAVRDFNLFKSEENRKNVFEARKDYKYYCRKCKQNFNRERCKQMNEMRKKKPKEFWKIFKSKKIRENSNISENDFFEYFKDLSSEIADHTPDDVQEFLQNFNTNDRNSTFQEMDMQISHEEILNAIRSLKSNKSCGIDDILNEYFLKAADILIEPLYILFNKILESRSFPAKWATGLVVPLHKKGSFDDTNNYRGITLISCFAKLFTSVLSNRLKQWAKATDASSDAQFGFKANHSTIDAIFILKYLIDRQMQAKKRLYCAFIDLKKAFDSVSRTSLWFKMIKSGIDGKLFDIIRSMYENIKLRVKHVSSLSDLFSCDVGLLQGEIISPFLFALFINDIELNLQENLNDGICVEQLQLYLLLFADDAVLFSETREGLQNHLNNLENYCRK